MASTTHPVAPALLGEHGGSSALQQAEEARERFPQVRL